MAGAVMFNSRAIARKERAGAPNSAICLQAVSLMASCKFGICFFLMGLTILFSITKHCKYTPFSYFCQGKMVIRKLLFIPNTYYQTLNFVLQTGWEEFLDAYVASGKQ